MPLNQNMNISNFEIVQTDYSTFIANRFTDFMSIRNKIIGQQELDECFKNALLEFSMKFGCWDIDILKSINSCEWVYFENYRHKSCSFDLYLAYNNYKKRVVGNLIIPKSEEEYIVFNSLESLYKKSNTCCWVLNEDNINRIPSVLDLHKNNILSDRKIENDEIHRYNDHLNSNVSPLDLVLTYQHIETKKIDSVRLPTTDLVKMYLSGTSSRLYNNLRLSSISVESGKITIKFNHEYHIRKYDIKEYYTCQIDINSFEIDAMEVDNIEREYTW